jgi:hypothetical protein
MGEQDDLGAFLREFLDRRHDAMDAGAVGDDAIGHRHVQVNAHENALAGNVGGKVVKRLEAHWSSLPVGSTVLIASGGRASNAS